VPDLNEIRAILADIREDDARAGAVIDRMRALLKRQDLDKELLKIDHLVGDVVAFVRTSAEARHIRLQLNVAAGLPRIAGERVHLQQVMLNLIINGMDSLDGASAEKRRVDIDARSIDPTSVQISVSDRGHGIPPDRIEKIFEPFFTTKADGLGMGLSISRTIVEAHHGHLRAANNDHGGATFVLTLPAASAVG
jgi:signal transduction histidine kinase